MAGVLMFDSRAGQRPAYYRDKGHLWARRMWRSHRYFKRRLRMSRSSFNHLFALVGPHLAPDRRRSGGAARTVPARVRLMLVLYWLAHGGSQISISDGADVPSSTFSDTLREVVDALLSSLPPPEFPSMAEEQQTLADEWLELHSCPIVGVVGALDGTLIRILTPPRAVKTAFNTRKCFYGVSLMAICDAKKRFLWCRSGVPGSTADSRAFKDSQWYRRQRTAGRRMLRTGVLLLADGGFALEEWLLKPYLREQLNAARKQYNKVLSSARALVEQAFGLLKGRWRVLHDVVSAETELVPSIMEACARLHNYLVDLNDPWDAAVDAQATHTNEVVVDVPTGEAYKRAWAAREALVAELWEVYGA